MATRNVKVENRAGVHMRPSTLITKTSHEFKSDIFILYNNAKINARSVMGVLSMAAMYGTELTLEAVGEDEEEALNALEALFINKFAED
ncbi:MAG: HPr family phosphocarrier protein [Treponema sp.]